MLNAKQLARALGNSSTRREGAEWRTLCPVHEADGGAHNPSLSIGDRNGALVWTCRVGCDKGAVTAAIRERGLLNGNGTRPARRRAKLGRKISRTKWIIRDIDGNPVAAHHRVDFEDDEGERHKEYPFPGGLKGRPPSSLPMYGTEQLKDLPDGARVVISEGEKAADALRRAGFVALGTVTGAKKTGGDVHCDDVLRHLTRFSVVLWPDNDAVGRAHMQRHSARLLALGVKELRVIEWADAPESGDAADYEGDETALLGLIEAAKPFETAAIQVQAFRRFASEIADRQIEYVVPRLIPRAKLCEFGGDPGEAKTYIARDLAAAITRGRSFAGQACKQGRVTFLSAEDDPEDIRQRLKEADADLEMVGVLSDSFETENGIQPIVLPDHIAKIEEILRADYALVLFIDPLMAFLNAKTDSNNDSSSRRVLAELKRLAQRTGTAICVLRHLNKMGSVSKAMYRGGGSIAFTAATRISFLIAPDPTDQASEMLRRRVFACIKTNIPGPKPPSMAFVLRSDAVEIPAHVEWLQEPSQLTADDLLRDIP